MKLNRKWLLAIALVLSLTMAISGTLAYLTDRDTVENTFTMGNVDIEVEEDFPEEGAPIKPGETVNKDAKIKNEGSNPAWVWMTVSVPEGLKDYVTMNWANGFAPTANSPVVENGQAVWTVLVDKQLPADGETGYILDSVKLSEYVDYQGGKYVVVKGGQVEQLEGIVDGKMVVTVTGYATQVDGLDSVEKAYAAYQGQWGEGGSNTDKVVVNPSTIEDVDFTVPGQIFELEGEFNDVTITELGEDSVISFDNATVGTLTIGDDVVLEGDAKINSIGVRRDNTEPITVTLRKANLEVVEGISVNNTDGKSILNIENSRIEAATIYVGEHVNNHRDALAELNIINSYVSCEENGMGSTINVWGRSGVKAKIYDSEIYTYSRGWHQSEDANDNSITFQGATSIDVDIQRSNMHLYGARSIINARQYGSEATTFNTKIEDSLIWVVTKSSHGEETLPVWGFDESNINNSILLFTKNVHQSTPAVFKSFVYGNPTIHGDYHVTTQCQWDAPIALADGQTVTFASDADVSIYEGAGNVEFVKTGSAKVVLENGAVVENIGGIN